MTDEQDRWVARLIPPPDDDVDALLRLPLGLDIWERHGDHLVVAATAGQLAEVERRRLARFERLASVVAYLARPPASTDE